jgi:hypothetical protein
MPIVFDCPSCSHRLRVPDEAAGRKGKCPGCGERVAIPGESEDSAAIRDAFSFAAAPEPVSPRVAVPDDLEPAAVLTPVGSPAASTPAFDAKTTPRPTKAETEPMRVVVVDFNMTFDSMLMFMIKWALAAIPAFIILAFIGSLLGAVVLIVLAALTGRPGL